MKQASNSSKHVEMIPIDSIRILNARSRSRPQHKEIVHNIRQVGLKRPIAVSRRSDGKDGKSFDLICGEGRMEAFQELGQRMIPAFVSSKSEADCLLMSLVENIARRRYKPLFLIQEIGELHRRHRSYTAVAENIGMPPSWIKAVVGLIKSGEERLLAAVDAGVLPISLAADFAKADSEDLQALLAKAYEEHALTGRQLIVVRRLLERRAKRGRAFGYKGPPRDGTYGKGMTVADLRRIYLREASRQRVASKKAEFSHEKLAFITEAFRDLLKDQEFRSLLKAEGLLSMPRVLLDRLGQSGHE